MDPLSAAITAASVTGIIYKAAKGLFEFIEATNMIDDITDALYDETQILFRAVSAIETTLATPSVRTSGPNDLWVDVEDCLQGCYETMKGFADRVDNVQAKRRNSFFHNAYRIWKLSLKEEEIQTLRVQMHTHAGAMQIIIQIIGLHISTTAVAAATATPSAVVDALDPRFDELQLKVNAVLTAVENNKMNHDPQSTLENKSLARTTDRLRDTARAIASKATVILGARSTTWGGSQVDIKDRDRHQSVTTGSENGEPLTAERLSRIANWTSNITNIPEQPEPEVEPDLAPLAVGSSTSSPRSVDRSSRIAETLATSVSIAAAEESYSDDDEIEIELAQKYVSFGQQNLEDGKFDVGEQFMRKALTTSQRLSRSNRELVDEPALKQRLALLCLGQERLDEAQTFCEEIIREPMSTENDRKRTLDASHILAQINLRKGLVDAACIDCKKAMIGRRRLSGKTQPYFESIFLMSIICEAKGDLLEAQSYADLLPEDFIKPDFKKPEQVIDTPTSPSLVQLGSEDSASLLDFSGRHKEARTSSLDGSPYAVASTLAGGSSPRSDSQKIPAAPEAAGQTTAFPAFVKPNVPLPPSVFPKVLETIDSALSNDAPTRHHSYPGPTESDLLSSKTLINASPPLRPTWQLEGQSFNSESSANGPNLDNPSRLSLPPTASSLRRTPKKPQAMESNAKVDKPESASMSEKLPRINCTLTAGEQEDAIRTLKIGGFDVDSRAFEPNAALLWAAEHGHLLAVILTLQGWSQYQIKKKLGFKSRDRVRIPPAAVGTLSSKQYTPLHLACMNGHASIVQLLIEQGASARRRQVCPSDTVDGADLVQSGHTALEYAIVDKHLKVVRVLIQMDVDVTGEDTAGVTPLLVAANVGTSAIGRLLLQAGCAVETSDKNGQTALHRAALAGHEDFLRMLLAQGADIEAKDDGGDTALSLGARIGHREVTSLLLTKGANLCTKNGNKDSPLHVAAQSGHVHVIELLLSQGADVESRGSKGLTPMLSAVANDQASVVKKLLDIGAKTSANDDDGATALHYAAKSGNEQMMEILLQYDFDMGVWDSSGKTAMTIGAELGHKLLVDKLVAHSVE